MVNNALLETNLDYLRKTGIRIDVKAPTTIGTTRHTNMLSVRLENLPLIVNCQTKRS
jgi:hypothetical protein